MRKSLIFVFWLLFASTALAQEVPLGTYVGDGATGSKVYGQGFLACDVATNTCKIGDNSTDWDTRPTLAGSGGSGSSSEKTVCPTVSPASPWTPVVAGCEIAPASFTGPATVVINTPGAITLQDPTNYVERLLTVSASGGTVTVDLSAFILPTDRLYPSLQVLDGQEADYLIWTQDEGATWNLVSDVRDSLAQNPVAPVGADRLEIQDVSLPEDQKGWVDMNGITAFVNANTTDSDILGNSSNQTANVTVTAADHGRTIVCDSGAGMNVNVDAGTPAWSPNYRIYVLNIGAGACTVQDGGNVDVTIRVATGFTAVVPQWGGATIIGKDLNEVVVTGGAAQ